MHLRLQTYDNDLMRESVDFSTAAIRLVEGEKGIKLTDEQKARIVHDEQVRLPLFLPVKRTHNACRCRYCFLVYCALHHPV